MSLGIESLGLIPSGTPFPVWIAQQLYHVGSPYLGELLSNPTGAVQRVGDLLIWNGEKGRRVLGGLEQLSENSQHTQAVIENVQATQLQMSTSLGSLHTMSILGMGVTSLSGIMLFAKLNAIQKCLTRLQTILLDIVAKLDAKDLAILKGGVSDLKDYEEGGHSDRKLLDESRKNARLAGDIYDALLRHELESEQCKVPAVSYYSRCLLLALATEVRCRTLQEHLPKAQERIAELQPRFQEAAARTFKQVIADSPERFLDPALQSDQISLELLTEIYQQAAIAGVVDGPTSVTAASLFEDLRPRIFAAGLSGWRTFFPMLGRAGAQAVEHLRYLMACLEETNRVKAMQLRIEEAIQGSYSILDLDAKIAAMKSKFSAAQESDVIMAYRFI